MKPDKHSDTLSVLRTLLNVMERSGAPIEAWFLCDISQPMFTALGRKDSDLPVLFSSPLEAWLFARLQNIRVAVVAYNEEVFTAVLDCSGKSKIEVPHNPLLN